MAGHDAGEQIRELGGDPDVIDALAMLRTQVVEGITLHANPPATFCALRLIRPFFPRPEDPDEEPPMDQLAAMAYCFAEPVTAYLLARRGQDEFLTEVLEWMGKHFTGDQSSYRLGRVVGWCAGIIRTLDALNPRKPEPPTN